MSSIEIVTLVAMILTAGWTTAFLVQLVKKVTWPSSAKLVLSGAIALLVSLAASWLSGELQGFINLWASGSMTANQVMVYFTTIFTASQAWYFAAFRGTAWAEELAWWPQGDDDDDDVAPA